MGNLTEEHKLNIRSAVQRWWNINSASELVKLRNRKISETQKRNITPEGRKRRSEVMKRWHAQNPGASLFAGDANPSKRPEIRKKLSLAMTGKTHTKEAKELNRIAHLGKFTHDKASCLCSFCKASRGEYCGANNPAKDSLVREKISDSKVGEKNPMYGRTGESSPHWKGGLSFEPYSLDFNDQTKLEVRRRDNFICQFCGGAEDSKNLGIHHINYNKKDNRRRNLISLCTSCNVKANYRRGLWQFFFETLQEIRRI